MTRIAILWKEFPPYVAACARELARQEHVELLAIRYAYAGEKPFDETSRDLYVPVHTLFASDPIRCQSTTLTALLSDFEPEVVVVSGWAVPVFNRAVRFMRRRGGHVICTSDNPWRGDLKHVLGSVFTRPLFRRRYSAMFVPGERALPLANALGFAGKRVILGSYSCDWPLYAEAYRDRCERLPGAWPHAFVFMGSLIERKGLSTLMDAYRAYCQQVANPWELWVIGDGPLRALVETAAGVVPLGFLQPVELAAVLARAGVFVLASHREPWGVVIHEAAAAGLPVLCTDVCGAAADLVSDGYSGYLFEAGDATHLCALMVQFTQMSDGELREMGSRSFELSKQYTPDLWADRLLRRIQLLDQRHLRGERFWARSGLGNQE